MEGDVVMYLAMERLFGLVEEAVTVIEENLRGEDPGLRQEAAIRILQMAGLYGEILAPGEE